jgi:NET1-associated nuclear protein 1 (U3 small nucleolar RNA-associated protein 17)
LTAAIENVVVSPSGSSYALSLANNSVIVLSTTELDAKTNIVGIQSRRMDTKHLTTSKDGLLAMQSVPIAVDPKNAQQVLCAVPASQPRQRSEGIQPSPYLQTFDVANQRAVSRQALTRNNATDPNQGPDGKRILEPNVILLQISHDGQYLATVDEWLPPQVDLNYIDEGVSDALEEERLRRREVHFKIWVWDEKKAQWSLETRIDSPHFLEDASSNGRVLDLVVNPKQLGFATIGEDHVVRIWKPKTRSTQGIVRRGANEGGTVNWTIHGSITLPNPSKLWLSEVGIAPSRTRTLRLAYSADGSILAAGVSGASAADRGLIHLIDMSSGTIRRSMTEIDTTVLCGLGIVGRCLVAVTDCITVWDMVSDNLVYCTSIKTAGFSSVERTSVVRLAVNEVDGTFAVSLPQLEEYKESTSDVKRASSRLAIFGTEHSNSIWSGTVPGITLGLAARKGTGAKGYVALDSISCIRTIDPVAGTLGLPALQPVKQEVQVVQDEDVEEESEDTTDRRLELEDATLENEYDKPVVTQQDLELIFHNESAPQAPKDVFSAVVRLFGGVGKAAA